MTPWTPSSEPGAFFLTPTTIAVMSNPGCSLPTAQEILRLLVSPTPATLLTCLPWTLTVPFTHSGELLPLPLGAV